MAASLLSESRVVLEGVPFLKDVQTMKETLESLGAVVKWTGDTIEVNPSGVHSQEVSPSLARRMRASNLVMGALLGRFGAFKASHPGGCTIGSRPMDLHIKGFEALGAKIDEDHGFIKAEAAKLKGAEIHLDFPSVGATENIMMAATLAEGTTIIRNAAREPEIVDLQNYLNKMGARIRGAGMDSIRIDGVKKLNREVTYRVIPEHVEAVTAKLREAGVQVREIDDRIIVKGSPVWKGLDIRTMPFPGFPTDMQPQIMVFLCLAQGTSIITENIFENRYRHVGELRRMGGQIQLEGRSAIIKGVPRLTGTVVEATDLRAGAALALGGLAAENTTVIEGVHHLDRGYGNLEERLRMLGAKIYRETN